MNAESKTRLSLWLFNPFVFVAGAKALVIGCAAILVAGVFGTLSLTHFDGAIDIHSGGQAPAWVMISEGFGDWLCVSAALLIAGKILSHTSFRIVDVVGTQALARWPTIFAGLIALPQGSRRFGNYLLELVKRQQLTPQSSAASPEIQFVASDALIFALVALGMILIVCWIVFLMYKAFSVSCNLVGPKAVLGFAAGIIVAEIVSKIVLSLLFAQAQL
jgi:hypothetical protein